jgi:hypothetical protein
MSSLVRPITTRELLDRTAQIYRQNFILFVCISALPYLCWLVVPLCYTAAIPAFSRVLLDAVIEGAKWVHRNYPSIPFGVVEFLVKAQVFICVTLYGIIPLLLKLVAGAVATAATSVGVSDIYFGRKTTVMECFSRLRGKFGNVLYAFAAVCVRTLAGLILLIIPGIYWAARDGLAVTAAALEDIKGSQACARSAALTKDSVGRVVTIYFLFALLQYAIRVTLGLVLYLLRPIAGKVAGMLGSDASGWVWTVAVLAISTPFISIALTLAYYDQRVRLEAFNIETMISGEQQASSVPNALNVAP